MNGTFLDKILAVKREKIERQKNETDVEVLKDRATRVRQIAQSHRLGAALIRTDRTNIIAEIKRASPSKGIINDDIDVATLAKQFEQGGAAAISVLTEEDFFKGSLADLIAVNAAIELPILRKDFVVDEFQIYESAAAGADAFLLIVAALNEEKLADFLRLGRDILGMDVLVEVHDETELKIAASVGADIIGVNNRDLRSFAVSLVVSRRLILNRPANSVMIAESGLSTRPEIDELSLLGFHGFLIGETLMRSSDPVDAVRRLSRRHGH